MERQPKHTLKGLQSRALEAPHGFLDLIRMPDKDFEILEAERVANLTPQEKIEYQEYFDLQDRG